MWGVLYFQCPASFVLIESPKYRNDEDESSSRGVMIAVTIRVGRIAALEAVSS